LPEPAVSDAVLAALPKVELHQHLDCSLSYAFATAFEPQLSEAQFRSEFVAPEYSPDFDPYERCANRAVAMMQSTPGLAASVDDLFAQLADDNVVYAEIRFAPLLHVRGGLSSRAVVATVEASVRAASARTGIDAGVLLCTLRHFDEAQGLETARLAAEFAGSAVVGIDLAGDEANDPIGPHIAAFDFARRAGIGRTAHAGEGGGPASVRDTLALLQPQRIGHGVRSSEDPALIAELRARGLHLEVCITSVIQTGVYRTVAEHPIERLRAAGVSLGISSDGRTISDVSLTDEYQRVARTFGWPAERFAAANRAAIDAAFAPDAVKERVRAKLGS
jgi:adenosine deaminase